MLGAVTSRSEHRSVGPFDTTTCDPQKRNADTQGPSPRHWGNRANRTDRNRALQWPV